MASLIAPAASQANRRAVEALPRVREEPERRAEGPGFVTPGVNVEALADGWRITVERSVPDPTGDHGSLYPWLAEIPWPDNLRMARGTLVSLAYSCPSAETYAESLDVRILTENGNFYGVMPSIYADRQSRHFLQERDNFTPVFYGRMHLPWRFRENKPIALVFQLRPRHLPAVYEIHSPQLVRYER